MGNLEDSTRKQIRRTRFNSAIIKALAISGTLALALLAPNALTLLGKSRFKNSYQKKHYLNLSLKRLIEKGYVKTSGSGREKILTLTREGEQLAASFGEGNLALKKPERWDGKWRILIFDIPERRKSVRERVRRVLIEFGFLRLQDSVWVYPYDCEDLITLFKIDLSLGKSLLYIVGDQIESEFLLRKHFKLS